MVPIAYWAVKTCMNNSTQIGICTYFWMSEENIQASAQFKDEHFTHYVRVLITRDNPLIYSQIRDTHLKIKHASEDETSFTVKVCKEKTHVIVIFAKSLISFFKHFGVGTSEISNRNSVGHSV